MQFPPEDHEDFFFPTENIVINGKDLSIAKFKAKASNIFGDLKLKSGSPLKFESEDSYDYWRDPSKWQKYSLDDTSIDDLMVYANAATETRKIIEMDKLRTKLRDMILKEDIQGISTLLDEEDDVFSLQSIKKHLPPVEVGMKQPTRLKKTPNNKDIPKTSNMSLEHLSVSEGNETITQNSTSNSLESEKLQTRKQRKPKSYRQISLDYTDAQ